MPIRIIYGTALTTVIISKERSMVLEHVPVRVYCSSLVCVAAFSQDEKLEV